MNRFFHWQDASNLAHAAAVDAAPCAAEQVASPADGLSADGLSADGLSADGQSAGGATQSANVAAASTDLVLNLSAYVAAQRDKLSALRESVPEVPVQAVADYSVGYGKHVLFSIYTAARKWIADDAGAMAAGVAYYLALSLFPMVLLLTAGLGLVFRFTSMGHDAEMQILAVVAEHCSPTLEQQAREVLAQLREQSLVGGPFGLFTAVLAAIGVFYRFERAFDRIWRTQPAKDRNWQATCVRIVTQRLSAFCLLASVGLCVIGILLANVAVGVVHAWISQWHLSAAIAISAVDACATLLLNAVVFGLLYRVLPKRRIQWVDALRGGLLASIVWEVGRQLLGAVLIGVRYTAAYGAIGSFIALLLWCYWGVSIIFFGAEYAQVLSDERQKADEQRKVDQQRKADEQNAHADALHVEARRETLRISDHSPLPSRIIPRRVA